MKQIKHLFNLIWILDLIHQTIDSLIKIDFKRIVF